MADKSDNEEQIKVNVVKKKSPSESEDIERVVTIEPSLEGDDLPELPVEKEEEDPKPEIRRKSAHIMVSDEDEAEEESGKDNDTEEEQEDSQDSKSRRKVEAQVPANSETVMANTEAEEEAEKEEAEKVENEGTDSSLEEEGATFSPTDTEEIKRERTEKGERGPTVADLATFAPTSILNENRDYKISKKSLKHAPTVVKVQQHRFWKAFALTLFVVVTGLLALVVVSEPFRNAMFGDLADEVSKVIENIF